MLSFSNGNVINLGNIKGSKGDKGDKGDSGLNGKDGVGIQNVDVSADGALTVTLTNGTVLNLGNIKGADGLGITKAEINTSGELVLTYSNGDVKNLGKVTGENGKDGANGADGLGIKSLTLSPDGELVVTMSDNSISNLGNIKGDKGDRGEQGQQGLQGTKGADGRGIAKTELVNGELVITYTDGTSDNLGSVSGTEIGVSDLLTYELLENDTYAVTGAIASISNLTIPSSYNGKAVTEISEYAFMNEVSLRTVTIPDGVVKICSFAFYKCTNLKTVSIPASVKEIEASAFTLNDNSDFGSNQYSFSLNVEGENNWNGYARLYTSATSSTPNALVYTGKLTGGALSYGGNIKTEPNQSGSPYYYAGSVTYKRN